MATETITREIQFLEFLFYKTKLTSKTIILAAKYFGIKLLFRIFSAKHLPSCQN